MNISRLKELRQRLRIDTIDTTITRRQLRWLGHVARVDFDRRLPRRMLSAWVPHPRPVGAPTMTYGRRALAKCWPSSASTRRVGRNLLSTVALGGRCFALACPRGLPAAATFAPSLPPASTLTTTSVEDQALAGTCAVQTMAAIDRMRAKDAALLQRIN